MENQKMPLRIGKYRGLQQCSTRNGCLAILALDHRNNLRRALSPESPESTTDQDLIHFKQLVLEYVALAAPAVLLDPEFGAAQAIAAGVLPRQTALVISAEATGYTGDPTARESKILPGWSIAKARKMGATAIKLLVYYHPHGTSAPGIERFVKDVAGMCQEQDLPLFLEPLSYSLDPSRPKLSPEEHRHVVVETARRLTRTGVDVLKAEFPAAVGANLDEDAWAEACAELTAASRVPWVLLSASVDFETYLRQVVVACQQGATGVAAGRAVWQEAVRLKDTDCTNFLHTTAYQRMSRLSALCDALAQPWQNYYEIQDIDSGWYQGYFA